VPETVDNSSGCRISDGCLMQIYFQLKSAVSNQSYDIEDARGQTILPRQVNMTAYRWKQQPV
jgi:hypothetical protein